ncbi:MAG: ATP-binding protein [Aggregatilineales bacterium]
MILFPPTPLSFETLVQQTARELAREHPNVTSAQVREVLQDAGIHDSLQDSTPAPQGQIVIRHIHVTGDKRRSDGSYTPFDYRRALGPGLWAWVGRNGSGKSTILGCILWALTGSDSNVARRVRSWIREIIVQFSIGDQGFTSRVSRQGEAIGGGLYRGYLTLNELSLGIVETVAHFDNRDQMREVIDRFFMQQLGITTLRWTAHSAEKDDPDLHAHSTTWRTYANAIHIDDDSYDYLIIDPQKGYGRQDRKILEMMLGIEQTRIVSEIQVQADFAKEAYGRARARLGHRQSDAVGQISALEAELGQLEHELVSFRGGVAAVEDDSELVAYRTRRALLLEEQDRLSQELTALEAQRGAVERDILAVEREKVALQEQSEVEYLVNSLVVVRCPHCESAVDDEGRLSREKQAHACHVCGQPVQRTRTRGDLKNAVREYDQQVGGLRASFQQIQQQATDCLQRLTVSREESTQLSHELSRSVKQARAGFNVSYAELLMRKGQIDGQLAQLRRNAAELDAEQEEVETAARWQLILQTAADLADQSAYELNARLFDRLGELTTTLATQFGVPDLTRVEIDDKRYVRLWQGGVAIIHNDLARSERVKFKVAFHLALMLLHVRDGLGRHPGLLIIDTPGTAEVNEADFVAIIKDIASLHDSYGEHLQLLVATARPEALQYLPSGAAATPETGEHGTFF